MNNAGFAFLTSKIFANRMEIVIEFLRMLLADCSYFSNNWIIGHFHTYNNQKRPPNSSITKGATKQKAAEICHGIRETGFFPAGSKSRLTPRMHQSESRRSSKIHRITVSTVQEMTDVPADIPYFGICRAALP